VGAGKRCQRDGENDEDDDQSCLLGADDSVNEGAHAIGPRGDGDQYYEFGTACAAW
jgi:hypothetical protein